MTSTIVSPYTGPLQPRDGPYAHHHVDPTSPPVATAAPAKLATPANREEEEEEEWIWVLDPMTRKLRVPVHLLNPTQATATSGAVPSLCIAYLEGRCRHPWCRQAHVSPSAISQLRFEALNAPTCCHTHKDPHDISKLTNNFRYIRIVNNGLSGNSELIPTERVASTVGLLRYLVQNVLNKKGDEGGKKEPASAPAPAATTTNDGEVVDEDKVLELPAKFICRLHLAHRCRYLEDCNNIHLCREYELQLQPPPHMVSSLAGVTTSTRSVTIGDVCYAVTPLAVGDVTDEDFQAISDTQKTNHHNSLVATAAGHTQGSSASATAMPWAAPNPFDSAVPSTTGNSPMLYGQGGVMTPLSGPTAASGSLFPAMPDCWQSPSVAPGSSPYLQSLTSVPPMDRSTTTPTTTMATTHLRVYDVRPKTNGSGSGTTANTSANNSTTHFAHSATAMTTAVPMTVPSSQQQQQRQQQQLHGVHNADHSSSSSGHMLTKLPPAAQPASKGSSSRSTSAERLPGDVCGGGHASRASGKPVGVNSSTEGGASISTSGVNTPVTDGVFSTFLQSVTEAVSSK